MWQYCWPHVVYHFTRWFPRNNRLKIRIVLMIFTFALLVPQLYILSRPHSARFCGQHLFELLIVSIVFTFCMIGFSFLFSLMDPVPWEVKLAFHIFGGICFILSLVYTVFTSLAGDCRVSTEALYFMSLALVAFSMVCVAFFLVVVPFWVVNRLKPHSVLDYYDRSGMCYESVTCCSCIWHI